jgi:uncharacterized protein (DUF58 family)
VNHSKELKKLKIIPSMKVMNLLTGNYKSAFKGSGIEVADIREYVIGDNIRHIDWRSSAKNSKTYVKVFEETRELKILFAIDTSSSMNWRSTKNYPLKSQVMTNFIYWLGLIANNSGDRIGAELYNSQSQERYKIERGMPHLIKILKKVNSALNNSNSYFSLNNLLNRIISNYRNRLIIFLFTDEVDINNIETQKLLSQIRLKHQLFFIKINDPFENGQLDISNTALQDITSGNIFDSAMINNKIYNTYKQQISIINNQINSFMISKNIDYLEITSGEYLLKKLIIMLRRKSAGRSIS